MHVWWQLPPPHAILVPPETVREAPINGTAPQTESRSGATSDTRRIRIVICDDQAPYRFFLRALLEQHRDLDVVGEGWHGGQAIQRCRDEQPDLLVIDLDMPVMDGYAALGRVRELSPDTRILVLTGLADDDAALRAHAAGADHVFSKSVEPAAIVAAIRAMTPAPRGAASTS